MNHLVFDTSDNEEEEDGENVETNLVDKKVQINNFQKVFFVYHFIKEFEWKFYITVKVGKYKKVFCSIFKKK